MSGAFLCPWHRNVCDWHHHSYCAVLQIYAVASHAVCSFGSHCLYYVLSVPHAAADRKQEALNQPRRVCVRRTLHLRRHRPDLPLLAANYRGFDQINPPKGMQITWVYRVQNNTVLFKSFPFLSESLDIYKSLMYS